MHVNDYNPGTARAAMSRIEQANPTRSGSGSRQSATFRDPILPCFVDPGRDCPTGEVFGYVAVLIAMTYIFAQ